MKKKFFQYVTQYITTSKLILFLTIGLLCCFDFIILYIIAPPHFGSNDDIGFLCLYSGIQTGTPSNIAQFTGIIWSTLFSSLYSFFPAIPWYPLLHIVIIFFAILTISYITTLVLIYKGFPIISLFIINTFSYFTLFGYHASNIQFTTTPALCCAGAICCIFILLFFHGLDRFVYYYSTVALVVLSFFSIICRLEISTLSNVSYVCTLILVLCYDYKFCNPLLITLFQHIVSKFKSNKKAFLNVIIILLFLNAINAIANAHYFSSEEYKLWKEQTKVGQTYLDRHHNSYSDDFSVYNDNGWSESYYNLVNKWYALDKKTNDLYSYKKVVDSLHVNPYSPVKTILIAFLECGKRSLVLLFVCDIIYVLFMLSCHNNKINRIIFLIPFIIMHILLLYLASTGRITDRVLTSLLFMFFTMGMFLFICNLSKFKSHKFTVILIVILCIFSSIINIRSLHKQTGKTYIDDSIALINLWNYASNDSSHFFIYDNSFYIPANINPFSIDTYSLCGFGNVAWWGTPFSRLIWTEQLTNNGYDSFYTENLFDEKVLFASTGDLDSDLTDYLREEYGNRITYVEVYDNNIFRLYKLKLSE